MAGEGGEGGEGGERGEGGDGGEGREGREGGGASACTNQSTAGGKTTTGWRLEVVPVTALGPSLFLRFRLQ